MHERVEPTGPDPGLVLPVLEHRTERVVDGLDVELLGAEHLERHRPVDGLGDTRRLVQAGATELGRGRRDLRALDRSGLPKERIENMK